ncbi:MAG: DNA topoisomerase I [Candidatus Lokiarchaeota archaeon]|nr:DNA topoisomerase I [Candidatus Lokiarchaeota archaeon]
MDSLKHNGILVLRPPEPHGFVITVKGKEITLDNLQEEMAIAWVKKLGTPYVEDPVFIENFMSDFSKMLELDDPPSTDEVDFSQVIKYVESERARKEGMTKEEKKQAREERKVIREELKEKYGYVYVDGERMELANYQTEPSGIFMGRGEHPLRGRWKVGATEQDITLNLSPDAEIPPGDWGEIVWKPDCLWIAKWKDELTGKNKYIWFHDSTPIKQEREEAKFDKAVKFEKRLDEVRAHISKGLLSDDSKVRMIAAACYLIDRLSLRVGDEKDPDEADTVGATTLRVEHLTFLDGVVKFDFLGKDSVPWHKELDMPPDVYRVFRELYDRAQERLQDFKAKKRKKTKADPKKIAQIFPRVRSSHVNQFLSEVDPEFSAKVFRTSRATAIMREELASSGVKKTDPDFVKKSAAKRANLEVARVMNHTKQAPKGWKKRAKRYEERLKKADTRIEKAKLKVKEAKKKYRARKRKEASTLKKRKATIKKKEELVEKYKGYYDSWVEKRKGAKETWDRARERKRTIRSSTRKSNRTKQERLEEAQERIDRTRGTLDEYRTKTDKARKRYQKSKESLEKKKAALEKWKEKSAARIERAKQRVQKEKERVKKADLAKKKIEMDYALAKEGKTLNLGTSLKSYIHPRVVYKWCQKVDYDWRKIYSKALERKFDWVENC